MDTQGKVKILTAQVVELDLNSAALRRRAVNGMHKHLKPISNASKRNIQADTGHTSMVNTGVYTPYLVFCQVKCAAFRQLNNGPFGCDIRCHVFERSKTGHRCNIEDSTWPCIILGLALSVICGRLSLLAHSQRGMLDAKSIPLDIHTQGISPVCSHPKPCCIL